MRYTIDINEYWKDFSAAYSALDLNRKNTTIKDAVKENRDKDKSLIYTYEIILQISFIVLFTTIINMILSSKIQK